MALARLPASRRRSGRIQGSNRTEDFNRECERRLAQATGQNLHPCYVCHALTRNEYMGCTKRCLLVNPSMTQQPTEPVKSAQTTAIARLGETQKTPTSTFTSLTYGILRSKIDQKAQRFFQLALDSDKLDASLAEWKKEMVIHGSRGSKRSGPSTIHRKLSALIV